MPEEALGTVMSKLTYLQERGRPLRVGIISTGSVLAKHGFHEWAVAILGTLGASRLKIEHTMGVERVAWQREYIRENHPGLKFLFGEAAELCEPTGYCYLHQARVECPHCEVLSMGTSCADFSSLKGHLRNSTWHGVLLGEGSSGSTLRYGMAYLERHRPAVVLFENVVGLAKASWQRTRSRGRWCGTSTRTCPCCSRSWSRAGTARRGAF